MEGRLKAPGGRWRMRFVIARFASGDATRSNAQRAAEHVRRNRTTHPRIGNTSKLNLPKVKKV
ncbi:hypothetical protein [Burkholderia sp. Bp9143]|uniref:hypothetical protein n=1 Tax=Burkholderia sp. Bp9143 TaxID=2184574 RepID=UPI000F5AE863|nr:hypothetical protein [Burkholderia sp. Bp9143]